MNSKQPNKWLPSILAAVFVILLCPAGRAFAQDFASAARIVLGSGNITISRAGNYVLSGTLRNGQVLIDVGKNDTVRIQLNGVHIENPRSAAIYMRNGAELVIDLVAGKENTLVVGANYVFAAGEDEPKAAIFVKNNLTIGGAGKLTVTGNYRNGIHAKDMLVVSGGDISVRAVEEAMQGGDGVMISNGVFDLNAGNDGIKSNNTDVGKGLVTINGGTFTIVAGGDGIQADNNLFINAGTFIVDAQDNAFHSGGNFTVRRGIFTVRARDDAFHADNALRVEGGTVNILSSYEGLEGKTIEITGGDITVVSSDDAINAADGSANANGRGRANPNNGIYARISGGTLRITAGGDGIDANGNLFLEGGELYISGPSMGMQGAIDFDGGFAVTGGRLITAGSSLNPSSRSTQPVILLSYTSVRDTGSAIAVKDFSGRILLEYTARIQFSASAFSSPDFKTGQTYSVFINGEKITDITLRGTVTAIADNGGAYSLRRGWR
jgi:hypothetical protein